VKPDGFAADVYRKPEVLGRLAATLVAGNPWADAVPRDVERVVLVGMGSSAYAGGVAAARIRPHGLVVSSELASSQLLPGWGSGALVVATSASGGSVETLDALGRLPDAVHTIALTNTPGSAITERCHTVVELAAEPEVGGVACRSYQHTLALLLALECHLLGRDTSALVASIAAAAEASDHLISTESDCGQHFPSSYWGLRAPTSPHPPTGSAQLSSPHSCSERAHAYPRSDVKPETGATWTYT
jgi:fructoselysine-6-P-deglycase FrlB-like protein